MKAHAPKIFTTEIQIREEVQKEYDARYEEHQRAIQHSVAVQLTAIFLYMMHVNYGFGRERLRKLLDCLTSTCEDMTGCGFVKPFDCEDLVDWCKEYAGIDLDKEIQTEIK